MEINNSTTQMNNIIKQSFHDWESSFAIVKDIKPLAKSLLIDKSKMNELKIEEKEKKETKEIEKEKEKENLFIFMEKNIGEQIEMNFKKQYFAFLKDKICKSLNFNLQIDWNESFPNNSKAAFTCNI